MAPRLRVMIVGHVGPLMHCAVGAKAMRVRRVIVLWLVQSTGETIVTRCRAKAYVTPARAATSASISYSRLEFVELSMSALPPKADMCSAVVHVCFGPEADTCAN